MSKYKGRLNEVKEGIPVLKARLKGKAARPKKAKEKPAVIKLKSLLRHRKQRN